MSDTANFVIKEPIWKDRSVGLAVRDVKEHNLVRIAYKEKSGKQTYPYLYYVSGETLKKKPTGNSGGTLVYFMPIAEMQIRL